MSVKAKGINTEKILEQISKADIDEQIKFFHDFKSYLNEKISKREEELSNKASEYASIKERL